jgi:hypothetical protein
VSEKRKEKEFKKITGVAMLKPTHLLSTGMPKS